MTATPGDGRTAAPTVFFGTGSFAVPLLDALIRSPEAHVVGVVSAPDRPAGRRKLLRSSPVTARARELMLPLLQPARLRSPESIDEVAALGPVLGVLADYGQIVPPALLAVPTHGILNVHPSLLPRHRGASPIPAAILAGDQETGVTVIRMDAGLDTGPIVAVRRWALDGRETAPELEARAAAEGTELLSEILGPWLRGELEPSPQSEIGMTLTRPLRREDGRLDPALPAGQLERQVRAYEPWPGSYLDTALGRVIVHRSQSMRAHDQPTPGTFGLGPDLRLATSDGWLVLDRVQPAGGRVMSGVELLRGRPSLAGSSIV